MRRKITWIYEHNPRLQREWLWKKVKGGKWQCTLTRVGKCKWEPYITSFGLAANPISSSNPDRYARLTDEELFFYML